MPSRVETFVIDYGGPNVAKPLHVGHMRPAIVGESIKRIIDYMGHKTISDVHLGDIGLPIGEVIYARKSQSHRYILLIIWLHLNFLSSSSIRFSN